MTYNASELTFDGLIARLDLLSHQLKLITFLSTLVEVLAQYQQRFTLAVQLTLTRLKLEQSYKRLTINSEKFA